MRRLLPHLLALALGVTAAVSVGCGGDTAHLIPSDDAGRLKDRIAAVQDAIQAGDCPRAEAAAQAALASARLLPPTVDRRLKARIIEGLQALQAEVPTACRAAQTQTVTVPTVTETTPTETTPTTTTAPPTTTTPTTTTPTTTTTTPTSTTTTPSGGTGSGSGGTGAPQQ